MKQNLELTDEKLMLRVRRGDLDAFEDLYERFYKRLYHFITRFVKDGTLAEDILQETFLRVFKTRTGYKKTALFSTYIFTIARNLCLDFLKAGDKRSLVYGREEIVDRAMDISSGPSEILEAAQLNEMLRREIGALPEDQREALLLSKYSGLAYKEIAQIVGSNPNAVKQKVYRALLSLRRKMGKTRL